MKNIESRFIPICFTVSVNKTINCIFSCANLAVRILRVALRLVIHFL